MQAATRSARSSVVRGPTEAWERVAAPHVVVVVMVDQTPPLSILRVGASWSIGAGPTLGLGGPSVWALRHSRPVIPVTGHECRRRRCGAQRRRTKVDGWAV